MSDDGRTAAARDNVAADAPTPAQPAHCTTAAPPATTSTAAPDDPSAASPPAAEGTDTAAGVTALSPAGCASSSPREGEGPDVVAQRDERDASENDKPNDPSSAKKGDDHHEEPPASDQPAARDQEAPAPAPAPACSDPAEQHSSRDDTDNRTQSQTDSSPTRPKPGKAPSCSKSFDTIDLKQKGDVHRALRLIFSGGAPISGGIAAATNASSFIFTKRSVMINSPRSLLVCSQEGVDPDAELGWLEPGDVLLACKGDRDVAKLRCQHYLAKRDRALEQLRAKRRELIDRLEGGVTTTTGDEADDHNKATTTVRPAAMTAPSDDGPAPKRASTPVVKPVSELLPAGRLKAADHNRQPQHGSTAADAPYDSAASTPRSSADQSGRTHSPPPPMADAAAYRQHQEREKALKVARQVERMKRVIEKNRLREEQKLEQEQAARRRLKQQDREREEAREREAVQRYMHERAKQKKEVERAVQMQLKAEQVERRQEEVARQMALRAAQQEERDRMRQEQMEERIRQLELEAAKQRMVVDLRRDAIHRHAEEVQQERTTKVGQKMSAADELRAKLQRQREAELEAQRLANEERTQLNLRRRTQAEEHLTSTITRFVEKARTAEERRREREEARTNANVIKQVADQIAAEERAAKLAEARAAEKRRSEELLRQLEEEERQFRELDDARRREGKIKATQNDLLVADRVTMVQRMKLRQAQHQEDLLQQYEHKLSKIERLREETKALEESRKRMLHDALRERPPPVDPAAWLPGPGAYDLESADRALKLGGSGVRMATTAFVAGGQKTHTSPGRRNKAQTPGPGQYDTSFLAAIRPSRGPRLPPPTRTVEEVLRDHDVQRSASVSPRSPHSASGGVSAPSRQRAAGGKLLTSTSKPEKKAPMFPPAAGATPNNSHDAAAAAGTASSSLSRRKARTERVSGINLPDEVIEADFEDV